MTDAAINWAGMPVTEVESIDDTEPLGNGGQPAPRSGGLEPGSRVDCPDCGKNLTVTAAGEIRKHKCVAELGSTRSAGSRKRKSSRAPAAVRTLAIGAIDAGVSYGVSQAIGRYVPCDPNEVPNPGKDDADERIGPLVDLLWPAIPAQAQQVISRIADESDLILCALAWADYFTTLRKWAREEHEKRARESRLNVVRMGGENNGEFQGPTATGGDPIRYDGPGFFDGI